MKTTIILASAVGLVAWAPMQGMAEPANPNDQATSNALSTHRQDALNNPLHLGKLERADKIIGLEVKDSQGQRLGKVSDLAVNLQNGRVVEVIVGSGGVFGVDEKLTAVPPGEFTCNPERSELQFTGDTAKFKSAPTFKSSDWTASMAPEQVNTVNQYYGVAPFAVQVNEVNNNTPTAQAVPSNSNNTGDTANGTGQPAGPQNGAPTHGAEILTANSASTGYLANGPLRSGEILRASTVMGASVQNRQDQRIGDVKDLMVNLHDGRLAEVVVASGGFLGIGDEYSAAPPESFQKQTGSDVLVLDTTREALANNPHFNSSNWDEANHPDRVVAVYHAYNVQPYWAPGEVTAQNNPQNQLNPLKQGTSKADVDTTREIRRQVEQATGLSISARNVQIITINGRVTLRGPVKSQEEKRRIGDIAARVVSASSVDNQLQVEELSPTSSVN